jgi:hypothetical protein
LIIEIEFPKDTQLSGKETKSYYRDAFKFKTSKVNLEPKNVFHGIFGHFSKIIRWLFKFRNSIMKWFGFSASNSEMNFALADMKVGAKVGFLQIESITSSEIVCGAYEKNMDMWVSVLKLPNNEFGISTLVNLKTKSGKVYMAFIKPFHKIMAKYAINEALRSGRI